jgi:hypothetical protein
MNLNLLVLFTPNPFGCLRHIHAVYKESTICLLHGAYELYDVLDRRSVNGVHTTMHCGVVVPTSPLVTEITLSQLSQLSQDEARKEGEEAATLATYRLDQTQAFSTLMPTFKKIVSVTDGNSRMLDKAFSGLRVLYTNLLAEVAEMCGKRTGGAKKNASSHKVSGQIIGWCRQETTELMDTDSAKTRKKMMY